VVQTWDRHIRYEIRNFLIMWFHLYGFFTVRKVYICFRQSDLAGL